ncbi:MAG TPA: hypothetical protein VHG33_04570 [Woeseiaceae bacterium]|nr:hypothetical protein [Woeseiaceae bacterium]
MSEPAQLMAARERLSRAESTFRSADGLAQLEEGLALLEEVILDGAAEHRAIAGNLLSTYSNRICAAIRRRVESDRGLPEPELEHLFKVLLAFDVANVELPEYVASLKIDVARRLIDFYYEGHSAEEKQKVLEQLTGIAASRR